MSRVLELLSLLLSLFRWWRERKDAERKTVSRTAVRADAGGEWVRSMGGTDRRDKSGPADAGGRRDG